MTARNVKVQIIQKPKDNLVKAQLRKMANRAVDFTLVHKQAAIMLDKWVQKNFKNEGRGLSDRWPPFKIGGRWIKGSGVDASAKLLQDTGALRASHMPFHNKDDAGIGSNLPYSKAHQLGEGVPQRRTLPERGEVEKALQDLFEEHTRRISDA